MRELVNQSFFRILVSDFETVSLSKRFSRPCSERGKKMLAPRTEVRAVSTESHCERLANKRISCDSVDL